MFEAIVLITFHTFFMSSLTLLRVNVKTNKIQNQHTDTSINGKSTYQKLNKSHQITYKIEKPSQTKNISHSTLFDIFRVVTGTQKTPQKKLLGSFFKAILFS